MKCTRCPTECRTQATPGQSTGLPPFSLDRAEKPASLKVAPEERAQVKVLAGRVVELVREGVTGLEQLDAPPEEDLQQIHTSHTLTDELNHSTRQHFDLGPFLRRGEELFSFHHFPGVGPRLAGNLVLLSRPGDPRAVD